MVGIIVGGLFKAIRILAGKTTLSAFSQGLGKLVKH